MLTILWNWLPYVYSVHPLTPFLSMARDRTTFIRKKRAVTTLQRWFRRTTELESYKDRVHMRDLRIYLKRRTELYEQISVINGHIAKDFLS